jgi:hypothetical protein
MESRIHITLNLGSENWIGRDQVDIRTRTVSILISAFVLSMMPMCATYRAEPLKLDSGRILIPASINDHSITFAYDTGATHSFVFNGVAEKVGIVLDPQVEAIMSKDGKSAAKPSKPAKVTIYGRTKTVPILIMETPPALTLDIDGVLSWNGVSAEAVLINVEHGEVQFRNSVPIEAKTWTRYPIEHGEGTLQFEVPDGSNGTLRILIDTGSPSSVVLNGEVWNNWLSRHQGKTYTFGSGWMPSSGYFVSRVAWADTVEIGDLTLKNTLIHEAPPHFALKPDIDVVLGCGALEQLQIVIARNEGVVYISKELIATSKPDYNRLGAAFLPKDFHSNEYVAKVAPKSPAETAGILDGDILLEINGVKAEELLKRNVGEKKEDVLSGHAGTTIELRLRRNESEYSTIATLADFLNETY